MSIELPGRLIATEYRVSMQSELGSDGASDPKLILAEDSDGEEFAIVLKLRKPGQGTHFGPTSLACELICSMLSRAVGLPVPDYFVVEVSDLFANSISDPSLKDLLKRNVGENFGTLYHNAWSTFRPHQSADDGLKAKLADLVCFDASVANYDRTEYMPNLLHKSDSLLLIDHSVAFSPVIENEPAPRWLQPNDIKKHCSAPALRRTHTAFGSVYQEWSASVGANELSEMKQAVPPGWELNTGEVDAIFNCLCNQPSNFNSIEATVRRALS